MTGLRRSPRHALKLELALTFQPVTAVVEACTAAACSYGDGYTCYEHPRCDSEQQYETQAATSTAARQCAYLRVCDKLAPEYESVAPTATSNRDCAPLTQCTVSQYISADAEELNNQFVTDQTCSDLTICTEQQFQSVAPDVRSDRQCVALTVCHTSAIEFMSPTETTDRQCRCNVGFYDENACTGQRTSDSTDCASVAAFVADPVEANCPTDDGCTFADAVIDGTQCVEEIPCAAESCVATITWHQMTKFALT